METIVYGLIDESLYSLWETGEPKIYPKHKKRKYYRKHEKVVYFLEDIDGLIKIGFTTCLGRRISELEIDHGPLKQLGWIWGDEEKERELHEMFKDWRYGQTEWFHPNNELLSYIENHKNL